ncbi:MAG: hypothetical protein QGD94_07990, partial [Planctomycetia bacterium]|nr:hypothetical protein [Planctomycetia bacterium]
DKAHETDDQLVLANKDKVSGILESLSAGVAVVKTSYGKLDIKKERLLRVRFHTKSREVPRRRKEDIAVTFHDGAMLTLTVKKMDANQIDANAEFLGDIKILRRAVRSIQFNIYKKAGPTSMAPPAGGWRWSSRLPPPCATIPG